MKELIYTLCLLVVVASCSNQRYAYLSKVKTNPQLCKSSTEAKKHPETIHIAAKSLTLPKFKTNVLRQPEHKYIQNETTPLHSIGKAINKQTVQVEQKIDAKTAQNDLKEKRSIKIKAKFYDSLNRMSDPDNDVFAILSVIFGGIGFFLLSFFLGIVAIVFGLIGLSRTRGGKRKGRGFALFGILLGLVLIILIICLFLFAPQLGLL